MDKSNKVERILQKYLNKRLEEGNRYNTEDWDRIENYFNCKFDDYFKIFLNLMYKYSFEGEIHGLREDDENGGIVFIYEYEIDFQEGGWDKDMIPFYSIGNGDYECLSASESPDSPVYYISHEDNSKEVVSGSFKEWLEKIPEHYS